MASRYEPTLRELAMEPDEERRLEMAAEIDRDAADLDERWDNRTHMRARGRARTVLRRSRDDAIADRDSWKERYADRFFDSGEGITDRQDIIDRHAADVRKNPAREASRRCGRGQWTDGVAYRKRIVRQG